MRVRLPRTMMASLEIANFSHSGGAWRLSCSFRANVGAAVAVRELAQLCAQHALCEANFLQRLVQVLAEALNNTAIHAAESSEGDLWAQLVVEVAAGHGEITVVDSGPPYALEGSTLPDSDAESGRGAFIIRALCDAVELTRRGDENVLRMCLR